MLALTDDTFDSSLKYGPTLVMFEAPWAGPCNLARPVMQKLVSKYPDVVFATFDLDDNVDIPARYNIRAVPMFLLLDTKGAPLGMKQGAVPVEVLEEMINETL